MITIWGPSYWLAIHALALTNPEKSPEPFFSVLPHLLPCDDCKKHAEQYTKSIGRRRRMGFFESTVEFHNAVNRRLGKHEFSLEEARRTILGKRDRWYSSIWALVHISALHFRSPCTLDAYRSMRNFWQLLPTLLPPSFARNFPLLSTIDFAIRMGPNALFEESVAFHNRINRLLGRRQILARQAAEIWTLSV